MSGKGKGGRGKGKKSAGGKSKSAKAGSVEAKAIRARCFTRLTPGQLLDTTMDKRPDSIALDTTGDGKVDTIVRIEDAPMTVRLNAMKSHASDPDGVKSTWRGAEVKEPSE